MACNYRRLSHRVRYWQFITTKETHHIKDSCQKAFTQAKQEREKLLDGSEARTTGKIDTWTTPSTGALSQERLDEEKKRLQSIIDFLTSWENLGEELYDPKGGRKLLRDKLS